MYDQRLHVLHAGLEPLPRRHPADATRNMSAAGVQLAARSMCSLWPIKAYYNDRPVDWSGRSISGCTSRRPWRTTVSSCTTRSISTASCSICFHKQWQRLRDYAHENGVQIIGDIPIYVPLDSADVWSHPENFQLDPHAPSALSSRAARPTASTPTASTGATRSTTGSAWSRTASPGGCSASARGRTRTSTSCASTISAALRAIGAIPAVNRTARNGRVGQGPRH